MAHLTIYLPDEIERKVRRAAKSSRLSVSKWVAEQVTKTVQTEWPAEFLALAGAFADFPGIEEIRGGYGEDVPRGRIE